jgi:hypothetical protein
MSTLAGGGQIGWQSLIRQRLEERDAREKAFDEVVDNCETLRIIKHTFEADFAFVQTSGWFVMQRCCEIAIIAC